MVDWFSKACKLVTLKSLPTSMETAKTLFEHVFLNYSVPEDILPDRGVQVMSRVWKAFSEKMGINIIFTSSFHHQSNGQRPVIADILQPGLAAVEWPEYSQNSLT